MYTAFVQFVGFKKFSHSTTIGRHMSDLPYLESEESEDDEFTSLIQSKTQTPKQPSQSSSNLQLLLLSLLLFTLLTTFWIMDTLKDPIFTSLLSMSKQPTAKIMSITTTGVIVILYNKHSSLFFGEGVDRYRRCGLFYTLSTFYALLFVIFGAFLSYAIVDIDDITPSSPSFFRTVLGYSTYVLIESYGSLLVCIFWAFTNDEVDLESAKSSYGYIVAVGQLGAISGSGIVDFFGGEDGVSFGSLVSYGGLCGGLITCLIVGIYDRAFFARVAQVDSSIRETANNEEDGLELIGTDEWFSPRPSPPTPTPTPTTPSNEFTDGINIIINNKYMLLILGMSCLYEISLTILDFEMKMISVKKYSYPIINPETQETMRGTFASFMGAFGLTTNIVR